MTDQHPPGDEPTQPGLPLPPDEGPPPRREPPAWLKPVLDADAARAQQKQDPPRTTPEPPPGVQGSLIIPSSGDPAEVPSTPWSPDRAWNRGPVPEAPDDPPAAAPEPEAAPEPDDIVLVEPPRAARPGPTPAPAPEPEPDPAPPAAATPDDAPRQDDGPVLPAATAAATGTTAAATVTTTPGEAAAAPADPSSTDAAPPGTSSGSGDAGSTSDDAAPAATAMAESSAGSSSADPDSDTAQTPSPADAETEPEPTVAAAAPAADAAGGGARRRGGSGIWIPVVLILAFLFGGAGIALILGGDQVVSLVAAPEPTATPSPTPLPALPEPTAGPVVTPTPAPGWQELTWEGAAPTSRRNMAVVASPDGTKLLVYGGVSDDTPSRDTWIYDIAANSWRRLSPDSNQPQGRFRGAVTLDSSRNRAVLFGGESGSAFFNDMWTFDFGTEAWTQIAPRSTTLPAARVAPGLAYDPRGDRYIVTHGRGANGTLLTDTWAFDPGALTWTNVSPPAAPPTPTPRPATTAVAGTPAATAAPARPTRPPGLAFAPLIADELTGALYLIGGETADGPSSSVWQFDLVSNRWNEVGTQGPTPLPRTGFAAAALPDGRLALFGGQAGDQRFDDLWFFETRTYDWRPSTIKGPSARSGAEMSYDRGQDRLWLFGGQDARGELADLWRVQAARLAPGPVPPR